MIADDPLLVLMKVKIQLQQKQIPRLARSHRADGKWSGGDPHRQGYVSDKSRVFAGGQYTEIIFPGYGVHFIAVNDSVYINDASTCDSTPFFNIMNEFYAKD